MARTVGDHVAAHVVAEEGEITQYVEDLVAGRLVGEARPVADRTVPPEDQQVGNRGARAQPLTPQFRHLGREDKGSADGEVVDETVRRDGLAADLPVDGRVLAVIEQVRDPQLVFGSGVQSNRGTALSDN